MQKRRKPIIGIAPLVDIRKKNYWMRPGYMEAIEEAGGIPIMLPLTFDEEITGQLAESVDGLLFSGGQDVSPPVYGEEKLSVCGECCPQRDEMELKLFKAAYEKDRPVFGICRGIQLINSAMGGTLYQDIPTQYPTTVIHRQELPYDRPSHRVDVIPGTPLYGVLGIGSLMVNSCHHQAIKTLAPGLRTMAVSEDGLIEAVYAPGKRFIEAVQWHPEFSHLVDENSRKILKSFVEAVQEIL